MTTDELEDGLRNLKQMHLTDSELVAYCDEKLKPIRRARVQAHLEDCFTCKRGLVLLQEGIAALENRQITPEDIEFVDRLMAQRGLEHKRPAPRFARAPLKVSFPHRLAETLRLLVVSSQVFFGHLKRLHRGGESKTEVWRWEREDGVLRAWAVLEKNSDLTINVASNEMELDGARLKVGLGGFSEVVTFQSVSPKEVRAQVVVPKQNSKNLSDISVEII